MLSASSALASSAEPLTPPTVLSAYDQQFMTNQQQDPGMPCKWKECDYTAPSPDDLYDHLCNSHIGRKSTGNLCLTCAWEGCGVKCVKRDHITSHLRVHTPLKPHTCAVCPKTFKRPQDLKKHERIHTQEHHQLHKHSKAATSDDPNFNRRVAPAPGIGQRANGESYGMPSQAAMNSLSPASLSSQSVSPTSSHSQIMSAFPTNSASPYEHLLPGGSHSPIPPPALAALHRKQHEELAAYQARELLVLQQLASQQQQQAATATGVKRGWSDDSATNQFDGFYADMKKRRMEPVYDASMIDRLNSLVPPSMASSYPGLPSVPSYFTPHFQQQSYPPPPPAPQQGNYPPFGPDIRSEPDLAMFNQFMVTLGRDAAYGPQMEQSASTSGSSASGDDLFDNDALASLGLAGMPGIPEQTTPPSTVNFGSLYPSLDVNGLNMRRNTSPGPGGREDVSKRTIAGLPRPPTTSFSNRSASLSAATPSSHSHSFYETLAQGGGLDDSSLGYDDRFGFDSLARSRGTALPSAHIAPKDYYKKAFRAVEPLGAAKPRESAERSGIPEEDEEDAEAISPPLPLAALLHDDEANPEFKLAAIAPQSSSGGHLPSLLRSRNSTASPSSSRSGSPASIPLLPSIDAALTGTLKRPTTADGLARQVKRLELDTDAATAVSYDDESDDAETPIQARALSEREKRRLHALWIRQVIVSVNAAFREQQQRMAEDDDQVHSRGFDRERTPSVSVA